MDESVSRSLSPADPLVADAEAALNKSGLACRIATIDHEPFERSLVASTFASLPVEQLPPAIADQLIDQQFQMQQAAYKARFPESIRWILDQRHEPVARLWLNVAEPELRIVDMIVRADLRGAGIGTSILTALCSLSHPDELFVRLAVSTGNPAAHRLYRRIGFVAVHQASDAVEMEYRQPVDDPSGEPAC